MTIHVEIPEPLAGKVQDAARSRSTSPEHFVIDAVTRTLAEETMPSPVGNSDAVDEDPLLGLLADDPELADFISDSAYQRRHTLPMRAPRG